MKLRGNYKYIEKQIFMENNIMNEDFYKQLDKNEKEICDLCRDWNLGDCEKCEFVSRFSDINEQEEC